MVLGISLAMGLGVVGAARDSAAQDGATLWYRTRSSLLAEPGATWQAAQPRSTQRVNGVTFTFDVSPSMGVVETTENGRFSQVMVGCNDRARTQRSMLIVGRRRGRRNDIQAVVEIYCGPTAPQG